MTNAPFMLNVDCDMYVNNPQIVLHALCLLLGVKSDKDCAFVQFPQHFYDGLKDDPYGSQWAVLHEGFKDPSTEELDVSTGEKLSMVYHHMNMMKKLADGDLLALSWSHRIILILLLKLQMGWIYGSTTEDVLTGLTIHGRGWKSTSCTPTLPGFLGCAPSGGPATMTQHKRWATGLLEILVTRRSPLILTLVGKLQFRQCLAYLWVLLWSLRSVPELCYATLPAYCIISGSRFLPKVGEPALLIPLAIFITYNLYTLSEYFRAGLSARAWWNNQRIWRIITMTAWLFGVFNIILKLLGLSETVFEVTQKEQSSTNGSNDDNADVGRFTFDESPIFIPATTVLLVNLTALVIAILGFQFAAHGGDGSGIGEVIFSSCVVLCLWAFLKGLFGKGKYGIPLATVYKSGALALLFLNLSRWTSMG
ncbi:hypothetical protein C3L33_10206, partial [Rhododendron williamsianum]